MKKILILTVLTLVTLTVPAQKYKQVIMFDHKHREFSNLDSMNMFPLNIIFTLDGKIMDPNDSAFVLFSAPKEDGFRGGGVRQDLGLYLPYNYYYYVYVQKPGYSETRFSISTHAPRLDKVTQIYINLTKKEMPFLIEGVVLYDKGAKEVGHFFVKE